MRQHTRLATSIAAILMFSGPSAVADVVSAQCLDANAGGQSLRQDGKLADARAMLALCADARCPALVRDDCAHRLDELDREPPPALPVVKPPPPERVVLAVPVVARPAAVGPSGHGSTQRTLGIVGMGLGVAGVAVGTVFGLLASSAWNTAKGECTSPQVCPSYNQAVLDHATSVTDGTVSTVSLIAGAALLVGGGALFFTAGSSATVSPDVGPGAASLTLRGRF